jgi:peroxiredoxin Q/BCP|tara:strand:+ start:455 stop:916 length:462 start_codon:yes stop_codon:yes gene_type:complete
MIELEIGDKAPEFSGEIEDGTRICLNDFKGRKLILYFYPKDSTPGCTAQACNLTENKNILKESGFEIVGVSADSVKKHQNFIKKYSLGFALIADIDKTVINLFGVWGPKKFMGREYEGINRVTFVIDESGIIERIFTKVKTKNHTEQILESYK